LVIKKKPAVELSAPGKLLTGLGDAWALSLRARGVLAVPLVGVSRDIFAAGVAGHKGVGTMPKNISIRWQNGGRLGIYSCRGMRLAAEVIVRGENLSLSR
jgi:hypothetical protein